MKGTLIKVGLGKLKGEVPVEVEKILSSLYIDDIISGGSTTDELQDLKNSNHPQLKSENFVPVHEQQSYAKQQLGVKEGESKMLGLPWNKR